MFNAWQCVQTKEAEGQAANEKREAVEAQKALREAANVFAANETEKLRRRKEEAKELAQVHLDQKACDSLLFSQLISSKFHQYLIVSAEITCISLKQL